MKKILINFAHPKRSNSKINKSLIKSLNGIDNLTINDLYNKYPDFIIDAKKEQKLCEEHDIIIFQFPLYWYSSPAIIKEWMDLVLQHGWAYGSKAKGLENKLFMLTITAGGDDSTYNKKGYNEFTINELTSPFRAMSKLCKMIWLPSFMVLGIHRGLPNEKINFYAEEYRKSILALRDESISFKKIAKQKYFNSDLSSCVRSI